MYSPVLLVKYISFVWYYMYTLLEAEDRKCNNGMQVHTKWIDQLQVEKSFVLFFKTIVFNALISNILHLRLSDE